METENGMCERKRQGEWEEKRHREMEWDTSMCIYFCIQWHRSHPLICIHSTNQCVNEQSRRKKVGWIMANDYVVSFWWIISVTNERIRDRRRRKMKLIHLKSTATKSDQESLHRNKIAYQTTSNVFIFSEKLFKKPSSSAFSMVMHMLNGIYDWN